MREILSGVFTWSIVWPQWSLESYWLRFPGGSVLIDPMEAFGLDDITEARDVAAIGLQITCPSVDIPPDIPSRGKPSHLLDVDFKNLLPSHGEPILGDAKGRLRSIIDRRVSTTTDPPRVSYFPKHPV